MEQVKTRFLLYHEGYDMFLNRMADGYTKDMFAAIRFSSKEEAEHWSQGIYAPKEDIQVVETESIMRLKEVAHERELLCGISQN